MAVYGIESWSKQHPFIEGDGGGDGVKVGRRGSVLVCFDCFCCLKLGMVVLVVVLNKYPCFVLARLCYRVEFSPTMFVVFCEISFPFCHCILSF